MLHQLVSICLSLITIKCDNLLAQYRNRFDNKSFKNF